jgi:hypothetical protein
VYELHMTRGASVLRFRIGNYPVHGLKLEREFWCARRGFCVEDDGGAPTAAAERLRWGAGRKAVKRAKLVLIAGHRLHRLCRLSPGRFRR